MRKSIHRSENLSITYVESDQELEFEVRFPSSSAKGRCDALCPRCRNPVTPIRWEVVGPDGGGNVAWFACKETLNDTPPCGGSVNWVRNITFQDWVDKT